MGRWLGDGKRRDAKEVRVPAKDERGKLRELEHLYPR